MQLEYTEQENTIRIIKLTGKLDIMGANEIDTRFAAYCSGENVRVLVDLSQVDYLASIGIRLLTSNAKSLASRAGKLVLLNPTDDVRSVLDTTGILTIIPTFDQVEAAEASLLA